MSEQRLIEEESTKLKDLANVVLDEDDFTKSKNLIDMFNWHLSKKQIYRVAKLDELYDHITEQMSLRVLNKPDQFSNDDLLNYMKTLQTAIVANSKEQLAVNPPSIIQNNTQININNTPKIDRESRERILKAVQNVLHNTSSSIDTTNALTEGDTISNEQLF